MVKATGQIVKLQAGKSKKGDHYTVVGLEGHEQQFFDWEEHCRIAQVEAGDAVEIEHNGGSYPKVKSLKKAAEKTDMTRFPGMENPQQKRDNQISRMCALKCAATVLGNRDLPYEELKKQATELAEELHQWIVK